MRRFAAVFTRFYTVLTFKFPSITITRTIPANETDMRYKSRVQQSLLLYTRTADARPEPRARARAHGGLKFVRGIIRPYLAILLLRLSTAPAPRYGVVINNGDKGLPLLRRFKQYFSRTMSRNYYCPFPTADYASSFNASLERDRVANR